VYDFKDYPNWDKAKLLDRLAEVSTGLAQQAEQLAFAKSEEIRAKKTAWETCGETTATGRRDFTQFSTVDYLTTLWETEAEIAALTEEKWLIVRLLDAALS
jgi:hypothetical protein